MKTPKEQSLEPGKPELEKTHEGSFAYKGEDPEKTGYTREARYGGRIKGSENSEVIEKQVEKVKKEYEAMATETTPLLTCPRCGMAKAEWGANGGKGVNQAGKAYCCEGCAGNTGCTCLSQ